jgi:response regulator RpfG family c-di-GMP phosphodiesterase
MSPMDDSMMFAAEPAVQAAAPWHVLVVDDDPEVHEVTRLVLGSFRFADRPLDLISVDSARRAFDHLRDHDDIAVVLLDVVMESEQAGLDLVRRIREELHNKFVRIVLRTGQPGQAPEHDVIATYDINDYKEKTELTAQKLATTLYAALRSYRDMRTIEAQRHGLERVITASARIFSHQNSRDFPSAVLAQLAELVGIRHGVLLCSAPKLDGHASAHYRVTAATGEYLPLVGHAADEGLRPALVDSLRLAHRHERHHFADDHYVLHFGDSRGGESLLFVGDAWHMTALEYRLVELFCTNVSIAFANMRLSDDLFDSQLEMVYLLAGAAETRSQETAYHVRRVGLLAEMLGQTVGLDAKTCEHLRYAAPLHDIGKIGIPDSVLGKRGAHTPEEAAIMRTHAELGAKLLGDSRRPVLRLAAEIARNHHENWDGSGYPSGLAGQEIPISGRITMVADVFDALGSRRCYKEPWASEDIRAYMLDERGRKFDPTLIDRLIANWDEALAVREKLPDR